MNGTRDTHDTTTDEDTGLDPYEAASLLAQTTRHAQREFDMRSPGLSLLGAAVVLVALGAVWLSVRGQHPYKGPTAAGLVVMYGVVFCWIGVVISVNRRAMTGLSGRSVRQQRAFGGAVVTALVAVSVFQGVLKHDRVSDAIVYGTYPLTAQLIVLGALGAAIASTREDWPGFAVAIAVIVVAAASSFAGPAGVWLSDGVGCCLAVLGYSAAQAWARHR
ncbi:MAG: hypothetical protein ACLPZR_26080 [Solirubrobacteraceae bacterium]